MEPSPHQILKTPPKRVDLGQNQAKTAPEPTNSPAPKAVLFGVPLAWESTPPEKLAAPWTSIPPAAVTPTIAIVQLDSHSILVAAERGLTRTAFVVNGVTGFRIQKHTESEFTDLLWVTCPNGSEEAVGVFAAQRTWNATLHPSTYTLLPATAVESGCVPISNTD